MSRCFRPSCCQQPEKKTYLMYRGVYIPRDYPPTYSVSFSKCL